MFTLFFFLLHEENQEDKCEAREEDGKDMGIPAPEQATLWTRAAAAREATVRARLKVEQAEAKARAAVEADEAATANRELLAEPVPLEIELPAPATSSGPSTRRYTSRNFGLMFKAIDTVTAL